MSYFFQIIQIVAGCYLLFLAVSGKSRVFTSPYVKKGMEERYKKLGRIGLAVIGVLVLALGVVNIFITSMYLSDPAAGAESVFLNSVSTALMVLSLTALLAVFIMFRTMHDKEKKKRPIRPTAPRAAFFFDEEDTKPVSKSNQSPGKKK